MAGIFVVSAQSSPPVPGGIPDKLLHFVAFFGLAVVVGRAVGGGLPPVLNRTRAWWAMLICLGYAVTDELHQIFVPFRTADVADLLADAAGAAAGLAACWAWHIISAPEFNSPTTKSER